MTGHCDWTLSQDTVTGHCHRTLSQDTVTGHCHRTVTGHCHRTLSQDTVTGHSDRTLSQDTFIGHCDKTLSYTRTYCYLFIYISTLKTAKTYRVAICSNLLLFGRTSTGPPAQIPGLLNPVLLNLISNITHFA